MGYLKRALLKPLTIFLTFLLLFNSTFPIFSLFQIAKADGPVPGNDCGDGRWPRGYYSGYECYIRGVYLAHSGIDPYSGCSYTNRINYSNGAYWNFCDPAHSSLTNKEVIVKVHYVNNVSFTILQFVDYAVYNVTPLQPNLVNPQSNWELGPRTNGSYTGVTCDTTGAGLGCSVNFNVSINDPDDTPPITSVFEIANLTTAANLNTTLNGEGNQMFNKTLTDGVWQWRGKTTDRYNATLDFTSYQSNIKVDTTAPTQPELTPLNAYSAGIQIILGSNAVSDNLVGGVQYEFQRADDIGFATNLQTSGWISANSFTFAGLTDGAMYYYRVRSRDSLWNTTVWSTVLNSTQDAVLPVLNNLAISEQRISPQNLDGVKDSLAITFDWVETNPKESRIEIFDSTNALVREFSDDTSASLTDSGSTSWNWDGKNTANSYVADGAYKIKVSVTDQAGQQVSDDSKIVIVDNTPATLNVNQATGAWYNLSNLGVSGQTENTASLVITNTKTSEAQTINPNSTTGLFGIAPDALISFALNEGENIFTFAVNDQVGNLRTDTYKYYRENTAPTVSITDLNLTNNRKPAIELNLSDAGYNDGVSDYVAGVDKDSVYLEIQHLGQSPQILVNNGTNVASALGSIVTNCNTAGALGLSGPTSCSYKFVFNNDLQPDGNYTVLARVKDKAGNQSTDVNSSFELDSHVQNTVSDPTNGNLFNYSLIKLKGTAEKNSTILINVPDVNADGLNDSVSFIVNETATGGRISVGNCRATAAVDTDGIKEICDWEVTGFQLEKDQVNNVNVTNPISIKLTDRANNIDTQVVSVNVNVRAVTLTAATDLQFISPNGDAKQDGLNFINLSTNGVVDTWKIEIRDSSNILAKEFSGNVSLPTNVPWDGRDTAGNYIVDGIYNYTLTVTTTDGIAFATAPQTIQAVTSLTNQVIIVYPANDTYTNQGVTVVQGVAPKNTKLRICIDVIGMDSACDYEVNDIAVNTDGTFSVLVPIFRINGQASTQNYISAFAHDKYGNTSPQSNKVKITLTTNTPFESVEIIPVYVGINSSADYQAILDKLDNNQPLTAGDIQSLKYATFRSVVNQGTERVKFSFADYTNLSELPSSIRYSNIGYVSGDNAIHLNQNFDDGVTPYTQCTQTTCVWDFLYPIPPVSGGLYEIKFDGKLGTTVQTMTSALVLDANVPASPLILDINKVLAGEELNTNLYQNAYYSNSEQIVIKGVSDANAQITVRDQNNNVVCTTTASSIGFWSCKTTLAYTAPATTYSLSVVATLGANSANSVSNTTVVVDKVQPQFTSLSTSHGLSGQAWYQSGDLVELNLTSNEKLAFAKSIDLANPSLNCLSGIGVQNAAITDLLIDSNSYTQAAGTYTVPGTATEGRYCTQVEIQDFAGNKAKQDLIVLIDNTIPDVPTIDTSLWGMFNGINAQTNFVAKGRLNPEYVIKDNTVLIYGYAEESQIVEFYVDGTKRNEIKAVTQLDYGVDSCKITRDEYNDPLAADVVKDGVIVEHQYQCLYAFNFTFDKGEKGYQFQVKARDLAGNKSLISEDELIYFDKTVPRIPETFSVNANNKSIPDWTSAYNKDVTAANLGTGNFGKLPITNSKNISVVDYAEALSDMQYVAIDKNGSVYSQYVQQKSNLGFDTRNYTMTAGDGVYTFYAQSWDAAGNVSEIHLFQVELDTVTPKAPSVGGGMADQYHISMTVAGEPGTTSALGKLSTSGVKNGTIKTLSINDDSVWDTTLTFCSALTDRAGNKSASRCFSVQTPVRPVRPGECDWTAERQKSYDELVKNNITDSSVIIDRLGYSLSCQTYAVNQINDGLKDGYDSLSQRKESAQSCLDDKIYNQHKSGSKAVEECELGKVLGAEVANEYSNSLDSQIKAAAELEKQQAETKRNVAVGVAVFGIGCAILTIGTAGIAAPLCIAGAAIATGVAINEQINVSDAQATIDTGIIKDSKAQFFESLGFSTNDSKNISQGINSISNIGLAGSIALVSGGTALAVFAPTATLTTLYAAATMYPAVGEGLLLGSYGISASSLGIVDCMDRAYSVNACTNEDYMYLGVSYATSVFIFGSSAKTAQSTMAKNEVEKTGGRLGSEEVRQQNKDVMKKLTNENPNYSQTDGAGLSEEYISGSGPGTNGSAYVDGTLKDTKGNVIRFQTVDVYSDGTPTKREMANATRILQYTSPADKLYLYPKGSLEIRYEATLVDGQIQLIKQIVK
jgi:flagellar hook assembly protein FlgD